MPKKPSYRELEEKIQRLERVETERHHREIELQKAALRYKNIIQTAIDGYWLTDLNGKLLEINDAYCRMSGYDRTELLSMHIADLEGRMNPDEVAAKIEEVQCLGHSRFETKHRRKGGDLYDVEIIVQYLAEENRKLVVVSRDISQRKRMEESLRLTQFIFDKAPIGIWRMGRSGEILDVNEQGCTSLGYTKEELCGMSVFDFDPAMDSHRWERHTVILDETRRTTVDSLHQRKNGEIFPIEVVQKMMWYEDKEFRVAFVQDITERKRMEQDQKRSKERLDLALEGANQGIWDLDLRKEILYLDARAYAIAGYEPGEFPGTFDELLKRIHEDDREFVASNFLQYLSGDLEIYEIQCRFLRKDGTYMWVLSKGKIVERDAQGNPARFVGSNADITHLKSAEDALRQNEQLFTNVLESMNDGLLVLDREFRYQVFNTAMEVITKTSRDTVLGKTPWQAFPYTAGTDVERSIRNALKGILTESLEIKLSMPGDLTVWHRDSFSPLKDKNGNVTGVVGVVSDITEQKRTERSLRESEERFKALHNSSFGGIAIHDRGIILECNQGLVDMSGYSPDELIGMDGLQLVAEQSRPMVMDHILAGYEKPYEAIALRKNGDEFPIRVEARNIPYKGKMVRASEFRDLSEQKNTEREKKELRDQLIQAQKMESIGRLAGGVAHDLNNLLAPILGYTEMLMENKAGTTSRLEKLQAINKAGNGARNLVSQLLALSRKQTLKFRRVNMDTIILQFKPLLRRTIREDIRINIVSSPGEKVILGDPTQLEQIIMNLSVNGADAMADGGVLTIETDLARLDEAYASRHPDVVTGPYVMVSFTDTGHGMDKETCDRIFEPFYSTKGIEKGTGLGLATVYGIVKQHKGHVWVYSEVGNGSVFKVFFPHVRGKAAESGITKEPHHELKGSERILLAEDNDGVRKFATDILIQSGYTVFPAENGNEALEMWAAADDPIDLLVTDVIMPGMNGRELFKSLNSLDPDIRVIYMSGYPDSAIAHHGILDRGVHYIQKPFSSDDFLFRIRQVLDKKI